MLTRKLVFLMVDTQRLDMLGSWAEAQESRPAHGTLRVHPMKRSLDIDTVTGTKRLASPRDWR